MDTPVSRKMRLVSRIIVKEFWSRDIEDLRVLFERIERRRIEG
jgi:hypothetical protein